MAHYAIGDIQGCFAEFQALLAHIGFNPGADTLWLTGDLVNRGPQSLATLRWVKQHESSMQTVLGNHDLHLLALAYGYGRLKRSDTVNDILNAPDRLALIDWLRAQGDDFAAVGIGLLLDRRRVANGEEPDWSHLSDDEASPLR